MYKLSPEEIEQQLLEEYYANSESEDEGEDEDYDIDIDDDIPNISESNEENGKLYLLYWHIIL